MWLTCAHRSAQDMPYGPCAGDDMDSTSLFVLSITGVI